MKKGFSCKKSVMALMSILLCVMLFACSATQSADSNAKDAENVSIDEVLLSGKWIEVMQDNGAVLRFFDDGTGVFQSTIDLSSTWHVSQNTVVISFNIGEKMMTNDFHFIEDDGIYILKADSGSATYALEKDYDVAVTRYKVETTTSAEVETEATEEVSEKETVVTIRRGQTITAKDFTFTLNNVEFSYDVKPEDTSGYYSSYPAESGEVYIHIDGTYYNSSKRDVAIRDLFTPTADFDDGYIYEGFAVVDEGDDFTWVSSYIVCTPLSSCHYHGLISCPEKVANSTAPLFVTFTIDGTTYRYNIR